MKGKIFKISIVMLLIITLTMTNFIFLGSSLISYAVDDISTNHKNIEFDAYFKDGNGQKIETLERTYDMQEISLYLAVNVNKEGFFVGQVELTNSNFNIVSSESEFVSRIDNNKVYFNQLNVGTAEIEVKIKPVNDDVINVNMLDCESELNLTGVYRDNTEKDIDIEATRTVNMKLVEANTSDNVKNDMKIITNKIIKISGENKRVIQLSLNMGLNKNNYPIKQIYTRINAPEINGKLPEVIKDINLNTMSAFEYKYENGYVEITLKNDETDNQQILWRKQGEENVILTYIYDADVELDNIDITSEERVTLQNDKELTSNLGKVTITNEEIDSTIEVSANNSESSIYKGKLYSGIDKQYSSKTVLDVNLANIEEYISIKEESSRYILTDGEADSNVYYNKTTISKEKFDSIFGQDGTIEIYNQNNELLEKITKDTETDESGNIVIDYTGREPKGIEIRTSRPITEGTLEFNHTKTIKASDSEIVKSASSIATKIVYGYNNYNDDNIQEKEQSYTKGIQAETEISMTLNETVTEAKLEINRDTLSTIIANDIEIKLILKTDDESRDLYKNPRFVVQLPEQVESIQINSINLLYEEELKISNYSVEGRNIIIQMEGEQTSYKAQSVEGANIIINATVNINKTSIAKPETINLGYINEKANAYPNNEEVGRASKDIEVVAPKDVTLINNIKALNIETVGEDETNTVSLERGTASKQVEVDFEVINNNEENVENVYILGTFPTKSENNNIDISVIEGINIENASVYYTENENATTDLQNSENGWTESISNPGAVKKYLIVIDQIASRTSVSGSYTIEIPENLEYNQTATEGYEVTYTKGVSRTVNTVKSTNITMETGVGPKLETNLTATVGGEEITDSTVVKSGEVIKYRVQVSNVGSEDVSNVTIKGTVPEGTTLVQPADNYEYTDALYYKEIDGDTYEATIESLVVGDIKDVEYEVMVNSDVQDGSSIVNTAEINYTDVVQETDELSISAESGTLKTMVKRVTDRDIDLYETGSVKYFAIVKNISSDTIENVTVKTNKSDNLEVASLELITGLSETEISDDDIVDTSTGLTKSGLDPSDMPSDTTQDTTENTSDEITSETIEYSDEINIGTIEPGESKVLSYSMKINPMLDDSSDIINFSVVSSDGQKEYRSNKWEDIVNVFDVDMEMVTNTESSYVKSGDNITYTITVKNTTKHETSILQVRDEIPAQLTVNKVTVDGQEQSFISNNITLYNKIPANGEMTITIETVVNYSDSRTESEAITNVATINMYGNEIARTAELTHIIEADVTNNNDNPNEGGNDNNDDNQNGNIANGEQIISGLAWYDENHNGRKDQEEGTLSNVTVKLLNVQTNQLVKDTSGEILEDTTNQNGVYVLNGIANGQYIVIFEYNTNQYSLTTYKAEGVSDTENSDVRLNELLIEDSRQEVASTDIINIGDENISDIDIGLIELQNFDLQLNKYVNRIIIQNSSGTTTREYNNTTTAKVELDAKQMSGSNVIIEYNIVVTNVGEVAGYARNIVDYMPSDLQFSSELNKDWYERNNQLYTAVFANEIINPGESKTVTLTLTKTMGEDNLVTRNNAEIYEDYNDLGLEDGNSTPGNNVSGENDMGSADVIISIRTGGVIYMSIGITIAIMILASIIVTIIIKRKNLKDKQ